MMTSMNDFEMSLFMAIFIGTLMMIWLYLKKWKKMNFLNTLEKTGRRNMMLLEDI